MVNRRTSDPIQFQAMQNNQRNNTQNPVRLHLNRILYSLKTHIFFCRSCACILIIVYTRHASTLIDLKFSIQIHGQSKVKQNKNVEIFLSLRSQ